MARQEYDKLKAQWAQRRDTILRWYEKGQSMRSIAAKLGLSVQRVQQIIAKEKDA